MHFVPRHCCVFPSVVIRSHALLFPSTDSIFRSNTLLLRPLKIIFRSHALPFRSLKMIFCSYSIFFRSFKFTFLSPQNIPIHQFNISFLPVSLHYRGFLFIICTDLFKSQFYIYYFSVKFIIKGFICRMTSIKIASIFLFQAAYAVIFAPLLFVGSKNYFVRTKYYCEKINIVL